MAPLRLILDTDIGSDVDDALALAFALLAGWAGIRGHRVAMWALCLLVLSCKAASLQRQESVGNWLYGVAYRLALKARSQAARRFARPSRAAASAPTDPLAQLTGRELIEVLDDELAHLPHKYRAPLVLCYLEGTARDEAAQQLGCSLSTLKRRLECGRERLRTRLARVRPVGGITGTGSWVSR